MIAIIETGSYVGYAVQALGMLNPQPIVSGKSFEAYTSVVALTAMEKGIASIAGTANEDEIVTIVFNGNMTGDLLNPSKGQMEQSKIHATRAALQKTLVRLTQKGVNVQIAHEQTPDGAKHMKVLEARAQMAAMM
jgi:hypothetical protein